MFDTTQALNDTVLACESTAVHLKIRSFPPYSIVTLLSSAHYVYLAEMTISMQKVIK